MERSCNAERSERKESERMRGQMHRTLAEIRADRRRRFSPLFSASAAADAASARSSRAFESRRWRWIVSVEAARKGPSEESDLLRRGFSAKAQAREKHSNTRAAGTHSNDTATSTIDIERTTIAMVQCRVNPQEGRQRSDGQSGCERSDRSAGASALVSFSALARRRGRVVHSRFSHPAPKSGATLVAHLGCVGWTDQITHLHRRLPTAMSSPDADDAAILASMQSRYFSAWPLLQLCEQPGRGRFLLAAFPIPSGTLVFESLAYSKGVHESFKKRVCEGCLRYNHSGRFERSCAGCHAVWFCSEECEARANGRTTAGALAPSELHSLDCSLLRKLSSCKLDKSRIGVIRLLIRAARKMQWEISAEQKRTPSEDASSSPAASSPATAPGVPLIPTYRDLANLIGHAAAPLVPGRSPTLHQLDTADMRKFLTKLVGASAAGAATHASAGAAAASSSSIQSQAVAALPPLDVELLMDLLAKVESNGFGMYAPAKKEEEESETVEDPAAEITRAVEVLSTSEPAAAAASAAAAAGSAHSSSVAPAASPPAAGSAPFPPPKYIGVLLYPAASFFNHSCESNVRCVQLHAQDQDSPTALAPHSSDTDTASSSSVQLQGQDASAPAASISDAASTSAVQDAAAASLGPKLVMIAKRDIAAGEELCIEYIDCERSGAERRAELQELYRFDCGCTRCVREQTAESAPSSVGGKKSAAASAASASSSRPSYVPPASKNRGGQPKKGAPLKRKKIVPKSMQQQQHHAAEETNTSNAAAEEWRD